MDLRTTAQTIFLTAVKAADPDRCIRDTVRIEGDAIVIDGETYPADTYRNVYVVGGGKASARMGQAIEDILGDRVTGGWINTKDGHATPLERITIHECSHPVPDERGVRGTQEIIRILSDADERTLVICLLSGGGSALMPAPAEGITLAEKQEVTRLLLSAGAHIGEINTIRKHLSILKGGGMARLAAPACLHVLIMSDVIGDRLDTIASGPAVADSSTFADCIEICTRYGIIDSLPHGVRERFQRGRASEIPETAKTDDTFLASAVNSLIGNNRMSIDAAQKTAEKLGFTTMLLSTFLEGEAAELGTFFASMALEIQVSANPLAAPACIIAGGESTVTVRGPGKGGRNQEMALSAARRLSGCTGVVFLSGGTDGTDGPTDAAGGIVDGSTMSIGNTRGLDIGESLRANDSYNYLKDTGSLLVTGPTGTNVMDIQLLLVGKPEKQL